MKREERLKKGEGLVVHLREDAGGALAHRVLLLGRGARGEREEDVARRVHVVEAGVVAGFGGGVLDQHLVDRVLHKAAQGRPRRRHRRRHHGRRHRDVLCQCRHSGHAGRS